ncbi:MAG TPA: SRPBCC family protein, partial [Novosphingobium sp.]|nr:SRPBCC family protein [Novosphingobium sp.]
SNMIYNMHSPTTNYGLHGHYRFEQLTEGMEGASTAATRYRASNGKWTTARSIAETIWAAHKVLDNMLYAMTLEPTMDAALRLRGEMADETDPMKVMQRFWELQQDEMARRGVKWPERLTPEAIEKCGVSWHIFPNSIVLPTVDGALWYRFRPYPGDASRCFVDLWSFGRFAPGEEPVIQHEIYDGFEAFAGQNPFLEEDFPNVRLAEQGMKCRGWKGARINPAQEGLVANFHRNMAEFMAEKRAGR